jgi:hypothetical protein
MLRQALDIANIAESTFLLMASIRLWVRRLGRN